VINLCKELQEIHNEDVQIEVLKKKFPSLTNQIKETLETIVNKFVDEFIIKKEHDFEKIESRR
jgi:hypothetical protein